MDGEPVWLNPQSETFEEDVQKLGGRLIRLQTGDDIPDPNITARPAPTSPKDRRETSCEGHDADHACKDTHPCPHGPMRILTHLWMRCTQPALASEIRRGRHLIERFDTEDGHVDDLARMAADTDAAICALLDGLADEYGDGGPTRRRLIAATVGITLPIHHQLATVGDRRTGDGA